MASIRGIESKLNSIENQQDLLRIRQSVIEDDLSQLAVIPEDIEPEDIPQTVSGTGQRRRELEAELDDIRLSRKALESRREDIEVALHAKRVEAAINSYKKRLKSLYGLISKHNNAARDVCAARVDIAEEVRSAELVIAGYKDEPQVKQAISGGFVIPTLPHTLRPYKMFTIPESALLLPEIIPEQPAAEKEAENEVGGDQREVHSASK